MAAALRKAGVPVQVGLIEAAGPGWIGARASNTRKASLEALRRTLGFIARTTHGTS
jgi:hypothetical protein